VPVHPTAILAASSSKSSGGSGGFFILLLVIGAMIYLFTRTQRNSRRRQAQTRGAIEVGSRVITTSGMYGTVVRIEDDAYELEIDDDVIVRFVKAAVTRLAPEEPAKGEDSPADDDVAATVAEPVTLVKPDPADSTDLRHSSSEA
jgi:preprotein translocase subunit YajC